MVTIASKVVYEFLKQAMSRPDALKTLGFKEDDKPSDDEVNKAYREHFVKNRKLHPDSGGSSDETTKLNVAKDTLLGKLKEERTPGSKPAEKPTPAPKPKKPKKKLPSFKKVHQDIKDALTKKGWKLSGPLKVPYATSPDGEMRLWFKPQAIYFTVGNRHNLNGARTMTYDDLRELSVSEFMNLVEKRQKK